MTGAMSQPRREDIFTEFPASGRSGLIVRWPDRGDDALGWFYAEAADRLAAAYTGAPVDDVLLLPFLYLYRHAIELNLKRDIRFAARLRRNNGEADPDLTAQAVSDRLKRKGHRLMALVDELDTHLRVLGEPPFPADVRRMFMLISNSDRTGEAFRYPGKLPDNEDYIDFPKLVAALKESYLTGSATYDILSVYETEYQRPMLDEYLAEAEYSEDISEELHDWN